MSEWAEPVRPLRADEFVSFAERAQKTYVAHMVDVGIGAEVATVKAEQDFHSLLPKGLDTPGHFLYAIVDDGETAGLLWLADSEGDLGRILFVYGVEVDAERRGRGLGRAAMEFAEAEARRLGIPKVALNVFGGNEVARGFYLSLGYRETTVRMEKAL